MASDTPFYHSLKAKLAARPLLSALAVGSLLVAIPALWAITNSDDNNFTTSAPKVTLPDEITAVTALGRLEPKSEIIQLSSPASAESSRVEQLRVQEGDAVAAGQILAVLDSRDRRQAALAEAQQQVKVAQARLDQVKAGAKQGEIGAQEARFQAMVAELQGQVETQRANIASLEAQLRGEQAAQSATVERIKAELANAENDCQRYESLFASGAVSAQERDRNCLDATTTQKRLNEAEANLQRIITSGQEQINEVRANLERTIATVQRQVSENRSQLDAVAEVRPVDVQVAAAELSAAQAAVQRAEVDLALSYVRSPISGRVIEIFTRPGEVVSDNGIAEVGETQDMYAIAEVYESDISSVLIGNEAQVTSSALSEELSGTVEAIGWQVQRQNVVNTDPSANIDARVIEVRVKLDAASSEQVAGLTNLQVMVTFP